MLSAWHVLALCAVPFIKAEAPELGRTVRKERAMSCHQGGQSQAEEVRQGLCTNIFTQNRPFSSQFQSITSVSSPVPVCHYPPTPKTLNHLKTILLHVYESVLYSKSRSSSLRAGTVFSSLLFLAQVLAQ